MEPNLQLHQFHVPQVCNSTGHTRSLIHNHAEPFMSLFQLTASLQVEPAKSSGIGRLMSILTHSGFFQKKKPQESEEEDEEEAYALTYAGRLLVKDNPATHGLAIWEYASRNPKLNNLFNNAMFCDSRLMSSADASQVKWVFEGSESLVDVGGGTGTMAKTIAQSFPSMKCTVLNLPLVVAGLKGTSNLNYIGGDMFEAIPSADAVLLKWILHVKDHESVETQLFLDILMTVLFTGRERSEQEWLKLFFSAGFTNYKISRVLGLRSIIEIYP
ncbi:hypothetical protein K1719_027334 [Acacia pycnantha]|nr:hypothetical protein K1719_027334 [Acacia pycnantha]